MTKDYRSTIFLPQTDFPMKGNLPTREPQWLAVWEKNDIYGKLRERGKDNPDKFILHDGPPYANGNIHIGHAMNKTLKDIIVRSQQMSGKDAPYVPGWDCHGLPIEWMIEKQYQKKKIKKEDVDPIEFRTECRNFAARWVDVQREEFKRLGIFGDWEKPYLTMNFDSEATIVAELLKFAESGQLYRGAKPVMWSPVEKTALAEAEVEYEDITSTQIDVAFEITESPIAALVGAYAVIWTTTPWTIPVNQALAYGPEVDYVLVEVGTTRQSSTEHPYNLNDLNPWESKSFLLAESLLEAFKSRVSKMLTERAAPHEVSIFFTTTHWRGKGADLAGTKARHPMHHLGGFFAKPRPFLPGDFVTTDSGTGLVHMSPDHGEDDFLLCKENAIDPVFAVEGDGRYREDWLWLGGEGSVINPKFNAPDGPICSDLRDYGGLLAASADYQHSYPHSWRSKAKVIYRCTPQWFVPMDKKIDRQVPLCATEAKIRCQQGEGETLREVAMRAIADTRFVPEKGRNRIGGMVEGRPDWVLSRQRAWGVPITLFVHRKTGQYLNDPAVNARIIAAVKAEGVDAWEDARTQDYLGENYNAEDYERVTDILDVWFDSGSTHAFVLESGRWPELHSPADLYLEGTDQHRGWFQSSLLESCGTRGRAPYKNVLTHGFTLDDKGKKMSKSLGNVIAPQKIIQQYGADILRLWVTSIDYMNDHRIGNAIIQGQVEAYRKLRNTLRFLLGNLNDFTEEERLPISEMPELDRLILHRLYELDKINRAGINDFNFNRVYTALYNFCTVDLSAFYFDIRKDCLYCDDKSTIRRRAARTVLDQIFYVLTKMLAPIMVFTAEEVWQSRFPDDAESIHLQTYHTIPEEWRNDALAGKWEKVRKLRRVVTGALEVERREKRIGSSLQGRATVFVADQSYVDAMTDIDLAELSITSSAELVVGEAPHGAFIHEDVPDIAVVSSLATGEKCERCWQVLPTVGSVAGHEDICPRCVEAVERCE